MRGRGAAIDHAIVVALVCLARARHACISFTRTARDKVGQKRFARCVNEHTEPRKTVNREWGVNRYRDVKQKPFFSTHYPARTCVVYLIVSQILEERRHD